MGGSLSSDLLLPLGMVSLMFGMGLTLTLDDFRRIAVAPLGPVLGTLLQLLAMPLVGMGLAWAFALPPLLAAGLVMISACPGGMFSNVYVHFARGNTALSITLTATATMATLFTLPLWISASGRWLGSGDADLDVPVLDTALELAGLTVLPVVIGMWARARNERMLFWERRFSGFGALLIVAGFAFDAGSQPELPVAAFQASIAPTFSFAAAALAIGVLVPLASGLTMRDAATISVELVVKNSLLGIVLVGRSLEFEALVPIFAFAMVQTPLGVLALVGWRWMARRGWVAGPVNVEEAGPSEA